MNQEDMKVSGSHLRQLERSLQRLRWLVLLRVRLIISWTKIEAAHNQAGDRGHTLSTMGKSDRFAQQELLRHLTDRS